LGSIVKTTGPSGDVVGSWSYDPWGNLEAEAAELGYAYTAREWDSETGLYYYRARYYDPEIGRFISEDPLRFAGGINFFAYADNSPLRFIDPYGLRACTQDDWDNHDREYAACVRQLSKPPEPLFRDKYEERIFKYAMKSGIGALAGPLVGATPAGAFAWIVVEGFVQLSKMAVISPDAIYNECSRRVPRPNCECREGDMFDVNFPPR
jgi:RHS repeat-associated protein